MSLLDEEQKLIDESDIKVQDWENKKYGGPIGRSTYAVGRSTCAVGRSMYEFVR